MTCQGQTLVTGDIFTHKHANAECVITRIIYDNEGIFKDRAADSSILAVNALITKRGDLAYANDNFWMRPADFSMYWMQEVEPPKPLTLKQRVERLEGLHHAQIGDSWEQEL